MDTLATPTDHIASETLVLPRRGFGIDRRKALAVAMACWAGFAIWCGWC
ncbi:hypothetical protein WAB17_11170 [Parerythrobacter aurantius]